MNNTGIYMMAILMPSIPSRAKVFNLLSHKLTMQINDVHDNHPMLGRVNLLSSVDYSFLRGGPSIGKRRDALVKRCFSKYMQFLDDDEDIAPNYVETLLRLCQDDADVITFRSFAKNDFYWSIIDMRLGNENEEATPDRIVKRNAWHICPVKSEYAKLYDFEDSNYGEDWQWFEKVLTHCKTESHTDAVLHIYNHSSKHSEADKITNYVQPKP